MQSYYYTIIIISWQQTKTARSFKSMPVSEHRRPCCVLTCCCICVDMNYTFPFWEKICLYNSSYRVCVFRIIFNMYSILFFLNIYITALLVKSEMNKFVNNILEERKKQKQILRNIFYKYWVGQEYTYTYVHISTGDDPYMSINRRYIIIINGGE
jgi:hypothetical protein